VSSIKYQRRLYKFFDFLGLEGSTAEEKSKNFFKKIEKENSQWAFNNLLKFIQHLGQSQL
jgi:hypothetical protein